MTIIDTLIFDRTLDDVLRIKELSETAMTRELTAAEIEEWNAAIVRGAYNASDINRIGEAIEFADAYLSTVQPEIDAYRAELGVANDAYFDAEILPVPGPPTVPWTDYTASEPPIMSNDIRKTFRAAEELAARVHLIYKAPELSRIGYQAANAVERMIYDTYRYGTEKETTRKDAAERISRAWYHAGDLFCNEI